MTKIIFQFVLLFTINIISQTMLTPLEKSDFTKVTSYDELTKFIYQLEAASDKLRVEVIGKTVGGRNLYAMKFSSSGFGKNPSKIKVLVFAQQHGNEQSGKEAALLLARELLKPENQFLFDKIDFALVPQMNPDGSEKNQRRNGNGADINRNHLILTEPETIALHNLFDKYLFEVTMDVHEYSPYGEDWLKYGARVNYDEEIGANTNVNVSEKIRELSNTGYIPFIKKYLNERNFSASTYSPGGPPDIDFIRHSTFDINDGRQSFGIQNTFSFIQEGKNGEDHLAANIQHRTEGQMTGMSGLLDYAYNHKDEIKNLVHSEREKLISPTPNDPVAIQLDHFKNGEKLKINLLSYSTNTDTIVTVNDYRPVVKSLYDVKSPEGYLIPKNSKEFVGWAERHNLDFRPFKKFGQEKIEEYFVHAIDSIDFEGDFVVNPNVEVRDVTNKFNEDDYLFIPANQIKCNLIVAALEPKSMLGLVTYKNFAHLLRKEEPFPVLRVTR